MISELTIIIGIGEEGANLARKLRAVLAPNKRIGWLSIMPKESGEIGDFVLKGQTESEYKQELVAKADELTRYLNLLFQSFVREERKPSVVRYLMLCHLYDSLSRSIAIELAGLIQRFHSELTFIPCQKEAFLLLPPLDKTTQEKGRCYAFLSGLEAFQRSNSSPLFDILWLLDPHRLARSVDESTTYLSQTLGIYMSTDVYQPLNQKMISSSSTLEHSGKPAIYSSLGSYSVTFDYKKWIDLHSHLFYRDILLSDFLGPLVPTPDKVTRTVDQVSRFVLETSVAEIRKNMNSTGQLEGAKDILSGLLSDAEDVSETLRNFCDKLEIIALHRRNSFWQQRAVDDCLDSLVNEIRRRAEEVMDEESRGAGMAHAFVALLREEDSPLSKLFGNLNVDSKLSPALVNFFSYLLGWNGARPSETLKTILEVITQILQQIYARHSVPWKQPVNWHELRVELQSVVALEGFPEMFGEDAGQVASFNQLVKRIVRTNDEARTQPLSTSYIAQALQILDRAGAEQINNELNELRSLKSSIKEVSEQIQGLRWKIILPRNWGLKSKQKKLDQKRKQTEKRLMESGESLIRKKEKLLPLYLCLAFFEELERKSLPIQKELEDFCKALDEETAIQDRLISETTFDSSPIGHEITTKEEAIAFYHSQFSAEDIRVAPEKIFASMNSTPRLSLFYKMPKRTLLLQAVAQFATNRVSGLKIWDIEELIRSLGKQEEVLGSLASSCQTFLRITHLPEDKVMECLYIGVADHRSSGICAGHHGHQIRGSYQFFSNGDRYTVSGIKITHGFDLTAAEGIAYLHRCYKQVLEEGSNLRAELP